MSIQWGQGAIDAIANQAAARVEQAFNQGMQAANGQSLERAVQIIAGRMQSVGMPLDSGDIRSKLVELGWGRA